MDVEHAADAMLDNFICQASFGSIPDEFDFACEARCFAIRAPAIIFLPEMPGNNAAFLLSLRHGNGFNLARTNLFQRGINFRQIFLARH